MKASFHTTVFFFLLLFFLGWGGVRLIIGRVADWKRERETLEEKLVYIV